MSQDELLEQDNNETLSAEDIAEGSSENADTAAVSESAAEASDISDEAAAPKPKLRIQVPVIIAAAILLVTILCFGCWGIFFNKSLKGSWALNFTVSDRECSVAFDFENDGSCAMYYGGTVYNGTYTESDSDNGRQKLNVKLTSYGQKFINTDFYYDLIGNSISGRQLVLTDLDGFIFPPDKTDEASTEESDAKKKAADFIEEDGMRYYVYTLDSVSDPEAKLVPLDGAIDEKLVGIWLDKRQDSRYDSTFSFNADGTYQITYRDIVYKGCYAAKDGSCVFNIVQVDGTAQNNTLDYSFEDDKLVVTVNDVPVTLERTDNIYAFDTGIK